MNFDIDKFLEYYYEDSIFRDWLDELSNFPADQDYYGITDSGNEFMLTTEQVLIFKMAVINIKQGEYGGN